MRSRKPVISRWRRVWSRTRGRWKPHGIVLLYHRIADEPLDPQRLCVSPRHFAEHLAVLKEAFDLVHVEEMAERIKHDKTLERTAAVTFDDGYVDNLDVAKPLLAAQGIPATVFVSSGFVGTERKFYWDELAWLLLPSLVLPRSIRFTINGRTETWSLGDDAESDAERVRESLSWHVQAKGAPTRRQRFYQMLCRQMKGMGGTDREKLLAELRTQVGPGSTGYECPGVMSAENLRTLVKGGCVRVGAHTVNHVTLSASECAEQEDEIGGSQSQLEEIINTPVTSLSYPYGGPCDYDVHSVRLAKESGFRCACSNFEGVVWRGADSYQMPRFVVRNWPADKFQDFLRRWSGE